MSTNLYMGLVTAFIALTILSFVVDSAVGIASTNLTSKVTAAATTIPVNTTQGFKATNGRIIVQGEAICYTALTATSFTGATRGCLDTTASPHSTNDRVYTESAGRINDLVQFNEASSTIDDSSGGIVGAIKGTVSALKAVPGFLGDIAHMLAWDYSFYDGNMVYFKYIFLYPLSAGLVLGGLMLLRGV